MKKIQSFFTNLTKAKIISLIVVIVVVVGGVTCGVKSAAKPTIEQQLQAHEWVIRDKESDDKIGRIIFKDDDKCSFYTHYSDGESVDKEKYQITKRAGKHIIDYSFSKNDHTKYYIEFKDGDFILTSLEQGGDGYPESVFVYSAK